MPARWKRPSSTCRRLALSRQLERFHSWASRAWPTRRHPVIALRRVIHRGIRRLVPVGGISSKSWDLSTRTGSKKHTQLFNRRLYWNRITRWYKGKLGRYLPTASVIKESER